MDGRSSRARRCIRSPGRAEGDAEVGARADAGR